MQNYEFVLAIVVILLIAMLISKIFEKRRTYNYRKELMDIYVSSRIRQLADESKLNLSLEFENFKKWTKKRRMENPEFELDNIIEENLKDTILEPKKK